jgi:protein-S-isoprenylcysteine O-methyltransferase Ste14
MVQTMTNPDRSARSRRLVDNAERVFITVLFAALCYRFAASLSETPANAIFLVSEGIVAVMVLLRRSTDQLSMSPMDWIVGFGGTMLPMLVMPVGGGWPGGVLLLLGGLLISLGAKFSLRRSFGIVAANRGVQTGGLYAAVRHPMYLGYFLVYSGTLMINPSAWNVAVIAVWSVCQIARIRAEERILLQDEAYRAHADRVRFRLVPFVY